MPTPLARGLFPKNTQRPLLPPPPHGEVGPPHLPGRAVKGAAGCTKRDEPLGPCVSALEPPPPSWGTCGALRAAPPFSLSLCCHVSLLPNWAPRPFLVLLGGGAGFLLPHALGPQPGNGGYQVPCIEPFPLPCFPRAAVRPALAWNSLQIAAAEPGGGGTSLPASSLGTDTDPTNLCLGGQGGKICYL